MTEPSRLTVSWHIFFEEIDHKPVKVDRLSTYLEQSECQYLGAVVLDEDATWGEGYSHLALVAGETYNDIKQVEFPATEAGRQMARLFVEKMHWAQRWSQGDVEAVYKEFGVEDQI